MTQPTTFRIHHLSDLKAIGVQPGWFARAGSCSIWFEVSAVLDSTILLVAARDPKRGTQLVSVGNYFSSITEVAPEAPAYSNWIKVNREKSFVDKFYPNERPSGQVA